MARRKGAPGDEKGQGADPAGSDGVIASQEEALQWAKVVAIPYPQGQGGRRRAWHAHRSYAEELPNLYHAASTEAANAFGNGELTWRSSSRSLATLSFQILPMSMAKLFRFSSASAPSSAATETIEEAPSLQ